MDKRYYTPLRQVMLLVLVIGVSACATLDSLGGSVSWVDEVVLNDGRTILVERRQVYDGGGLREIGQGPPLSLELLEFGTPEGKAIHWQSDHGRGYQDNLAPLVMDVIDEVPYLITYPTRCHAYNKWERPNPPYVYFRYEGNTWQRIFIDDVPRVMNRTNLSLSGSQSRAKQLRWQMGSKGYLSKEQIQERQGHMTPESVYLREIVWEPMKSGLTSCGEMIYDGRGGWVGVGWFKDKTSLDACNEYCKRKRMDMKYCPCEKLFKEGRNDE